MLFLSKSQEDGVKKYIAGQAEHHKHEDFKAELLRFLRAHEIAFDERYVFDGTAAFGGVARTPLFAPEGR